MSAPSFGIVVIRLFAIYLAITALQSLYFYFQPMGRSGVAVAELLGSAEFWLSSVMALLPAVCAVVIWVFADSLIPEQAEESGQVVSAADLMLIGVSLLGLYFFVWGAISLVSIESSMASSENFSSTTKWSRRAPYIAQLLIAVPMLLGRQRVAAMLLRAKYVGSKQG